MTLGWTHATTGRAIVAAVTAICVVLGGLGVPPARAESPAVDAGGQCDRSAVVVAWQLGGPQVRAGAEAALVGDDAAVCAFLATGWRERSSLDARDSVTHLATNAGSAVRSAAQTALDSSDPTAIDTLLASGWRSASDADQRIRVAQLMAAGGTQLRAVAQQALAKNDPAAVDQFLKSGWQAPHYADQRIRVSQILAAGGPEVRKQAQRALAANTLEALTQFIEIDWAVASARDQETATIADLTSAAVEAGALAERETAAAKLESDRAVVAAAEARKAAIEAANAAQSAQGNAAAAAAAAQLAADAAARAADAARQAVAAARAASAAARVAADAAARAAAMASKAGQAASRAYQSAGAAAADATKASDARVAAQAARDVAAGAQKSAAAAEAAGKAAQQAAVAADAVALAGRDAADAATAAVEAGDFAAKAGASGAQAKAAAATARANADRATRAARAARGFAEIAASAAFLSRDAANRAAADALTAAAAADDAATHAGEAGQAAERATEHANAATRAAQSAVDAANAAKAVYDAARAADAVRIAVTTEEGREAAQQATALVEQQRTKAAWDAEQTQKRSAETRQLLVQASDPATPKATAVAAARRAAMNLVLDNTGPWTTAAALQALRGTDDEALVVVRVGLPAAVGQDNRFTLSTLAVDGSDAMKQAAATALAGSDEDVARFLQTRDYPGRGAELRVAVAQVLATAQASGGRAVINAAQGALADGSVQAMDEFLTTSQYSAAGADDRIAVAQILADPNTGPEVKSAAQVALDSPDALLRQFLTVGRYNAAQRDEDNNAHLAVVNGFLAIARGSAAQATKNALDAQAAAATARGAAAEAADYARQASNSATQAADYAQQAAASATQAEQSAARAATSANTAKTAAAAANASARAANRSASWAISSAKQAAGYAVSAYDAATQAFNSYAAATHDAVLAAQAYADALGSAVDKAGKERAEWQKQRAIDCDILWGDGTEEYFNCTRLATDPYKTLYFYGGFCQMLAPPGSALYRICINSTASPTFELDLAIDLAMPPLLMLTGALGYLLVAEVAVVAGVLCTAVCSAALAVTSPEMLFGWGLFDSMLIDAMYGTVGGMVAGIRTEAIVEKTWVMTEAEEAALARLLSGVAGCVEGNSFTPTTRVLLADGTSKPISEVRVGDRVVSTDPVTGTTEPEPVIDTITGSGEKQLVDLAVGSGTGSGTITATHNHPFWVADLAQWVPAGDIAVGQWLRTSNGTWVQVTATRRYAASSVVHNLAVADHHTYYALAGETPLLVHNVSPCSPMALGIGDDGALGRFALDNGAIDFMHLPYPDWMGEVQGVIFEEPGRFIYVSERGFKAGYTESTLRESKDPRELFLDAVIRGWSKEDASAPEWEMFWIAKACYQDKRAWDSIKFWGPDGTKLDSIGLEPDWWNIVQGDTSEINLIRSNYRMWLDPERWEAEYGGHHPTG